MPNSITPPETDPKARLQEKEPAVNGALTALSQGVGFSAGAISSLATMSAEDRKNADKYLKMLKDPVSLDESKFRQNFLKKVDNKAAELSKQGKPVDIEELQQEIFNKELMVYINEAHQKSEKERDEKKQKDLESAQGDLAKSKALRAKNRTIALASGAGAIVEGVGSIAVAPAEFLTGLAEFLNKNSPAGHGDELVLILKFFQVFTSLVKLPFDLVKISLDSVILQNVDPAQRAKIAEQYKKATKPGERSKVFDSVYESNKKASAEAQARFEEAVSNSFGGDDKDGLGFRGDYDGQGRGA